MYVGRRGGHDRTVSLLRHQPVRRTTAHARARRDDRTPAPGLAEHAGELLLAARGLRAMAGTPGTLPAVAATLGCVETALDALAACEGAPDELRVARDLTGGVRERVGPVLAVLAAEGRATAPVLRVPSRSPRDPAHLLYDHACALTAAAGAIRAASARRTRREDVTGALGAALHALADAIDAFGAQAGRHLRESGERPAGDAPPLGADEAETRLGDVAARLRRTAPRLTQAAAG